MDKLLTIIVPVFKVEHYINKCLDSLILAPELMKKMDVLIINDGTPDRSAEMSREYVKRFPGVFRQIDKENGGHGSVWNLGLKEAYGRYIRFLDSDDWLENLEVLMDKLKSTDVDIVLTHTLDHCENNELWKDEVRGYEFEKIYNMDTYDWSHHKGSYNSFLHHSCTFKREILIKHIPLFLEKQPYDDDILPTVVLVAAKTLVAFDFVLYHYLMDRPGQSMSPEVRKRNRNANVKSSQQIIKWIEQHPVSKTSTKYPILNKWHSRLAEKGYMPQLELSYSENKNYISEWNEWMKSNSKYCSLSTVSYRLLPFPFFYAIYATLFKLKTKLKSPIRNR